MKPKIQSLGIRIPNLSDKVVLDGRHDCCCRFATITGCTKEPTSAAQSYGSDLRPELGKNYNTSRGKKVVAEVLLVPGVGLIEQSVEDAYFVGNARCSEPARVTQCQNHPALESMYEIVMKPTNCPTQSQPNPRKIRLKVAFGPLIPTAYSFSRVAIDFI